MDFKKLTNAIKKKKKKKKKRGLCSNLEQIALHLHVSWEQSSCLPADTGQSSPTIAILCNVQFPYIVPDVLYGERRTRSFSLAVKRHTHAPSSITKTPLEIQQAIRQHDETWDRRIQRRLRVSPQPLWGVCQTFIFPVHPGLLLR